MVYTVAKLAKISGVSIRTLHWYDAIGLLKPAYHGVNGYRYYGEEQLLILQQILFFRELGFELKQIERILKRSDFDKVIALSSHQAVLQRNVERTQQLIQTIDDTIKHLQGMKKMKDYEMYRGFDKEKQEEYQKYLINRFGDKVKNSVKESNDNVKKMSKEDVETNQKEWESILSDLAKQWKRQASVESTEVQKIIHRHYALLKKYWTPDKESYAGMGKVYAGLEWKDAFKAYDAEHPKLALYFSEAISAFSKKELA